MSQFNKGVIGAVAFLRFRKIYLSLEGTKEYDEGNGREVDIFFAGFILYYYYYYYFIMNNSSK